MDDGHLKYYVGSLCSKESSDYQNENFEQSINHENNVYKSLSKQNLFYFYSGIFNFVELNLYDTDYTDFDTKKNYAVLKKWFEQTNPDFRFSIRIPNLYCFLKNPKIIRYLTERVQTMRNQNCRKMKMIMDFQIKTILQVF